MLKEFKKQVFISAMLHDVGKLWQRGDSELSKKKHYKLSKEFVQTVYNDENISFIVSKHHKAEIKESDGTKIQNTLARIVCEADSLSSGEREEDKSQLQQEPLYSILSRIDYKNTEPIKYYQPLTRLNPENYAFPEVHFEKNVFENDYIKKWDEFTSDFENFDKDSPEVLYYLSKKHFWCIPSSCWKSVPDVSLHEHSRLTAAISLSIINFLDEKYQDINKINSKIIEDRDEIRYLLIGADITGIQKYIYNISHTGAAKSLKGRSFLLQQYLDVISNTLVDENHLNLSPANILYSSGGKVYILAHSTDNSKKILEDFQFNLEKKLLIEFNGELGIVFSSIELKGKDFYEKSGSKFLITEKWDDLSKKLEIAKRNKFSGIIDYSFFRPIEPCGDVIQCSATSKDLCLKSDINEENAKGILSIGENIKFIKYETKFGNVYNYLDENGNSTDEYISEEQFSSQLIGQKLKSRLKAISYNGSDKSINILGYTNIDVITDKSKLKNDSIAFIVNDDNFLLYKGVKGFKFYGGTWSLKKEFDSICDDTELGLKRLGILRMDVDNLGKIFKDGLGGIATISRIVQLSSMLDFFFSCYINKIEDLYWDYDKGITETRTDFPLGDYTQIVYSGGDDLFIVGLWNILPDLAIWINNEFRKFTCNNDNFSLSAGIYIFPSKYPLYKSAELAGNAEEESKRFIRNVNSSIIEKNAVTFLDTTLSWKDFEYVSKWVRELYSLINKGDVKKSLINRLQNIYGSYFEDNKNLWSRWRWLACYSLSRYASQYKNAKKAINRLSMELFISNKSEQEFITILNLPARWAEYLTRKEK